MISEDQAIAVARVRAEQNGWHCGEPIRCEFRRGWLRSESRYEIETNAGRLGTKARFVIDAETGAIIDEGYIPR